MHDDVTAEPIKAYHSRVKRFGELPDDNATEVYLEAFLFLEFEFDLEELYVLDGHIVIGPPWHDDVQ